MNDNFAMVLTVLIVCITVWKITRLILFGKED